MPRSLPAAAALAAAVLFPASAVAQSVGGFSVRPARFDPSDPATRAYFKHTVAPGDSFGARVVVSNTARKPLDLLVYAVDGRTGATSGTVFANRQDRVAEAGAWVRLHVKRVTVPARGERELPFAVKVPDRATPGDHVAGIALEGAHPKASGGRFSITQVIRAVVGVKITVDGRAGRALRLAGASIQPLPGTKLSSVILGITNTGRTLCKPRLAVQVGGAGRPLTLARKLDTVLPGDTIAYPLAWPHSLAVGSYHVAARATGCGAPARLSTTAAIKEPLGAAGATGPAPIAQTPQPAKQPIWLMLGVGAGGLAAGIGVGAGRRRLRSRKAAA